LQGEKNVMRFNPGSIIIRTCWVYSEFGKNFVKTMLRLMADKDQISVVSDQAGTPTYAADLAEAILQIISSQQWAPGVYHFSNEGNITWYDFAVAIKELSGSACKVNPIPTSQYPRRPGGLSIPCWIKTRLSRLLVFIFPDGRIALPFAWIKLRMPRNNFRALLLYQTVLLSIVRYKNMSKAVQGSQVWQIQQYPLSVMQVY
jgi:dTDP-4-dehydrorhamnose reductase